MILIEKTNNSTLTITEFGTNGTSGTPQYFTVVPAADCAVQVRYDFDDIRTRKRTVYITSKYSGKVLAQVTSENLHFLSTGYSSDMDTYGKNLRNSVLYS